MDYKNYWQPAVYAMEALHCVNEVMPGHYIFNQPNRNSLRAVFMISQVVKWLLKEGGAQRDFANDARGIAFLYAAANGHSEVINGC